MERSGLRTRFERRGVGFRRIAAVPVDDVEERNGTTAPGFVDNFRSGRFFGGVFGVRVFIVPIFAEREERFEFGPIRIVRGTRFENETVFRDPLHRRKFELRRINQTDAVDRRFALERFALVGVFETSERALNVQSAVSE